ncbi:hypothetical protein [Heyndrickxia ginsengihumi]|nr:hypothetical protein [Heyndrickxia ginsengihumi]
MILVKTVSKLGNHTFKLGGNVKTIEQAQEVLKNMYPFEIKAVSLENCR